MLMMNDAQRHLLRTNGLVLGRTLIGFFFLYSGVNILMTGAAQVAGIYASLGVPMAALAVWLVVAVKLLGGAALIVGFRTGLAAGALIIFTLLATYFGHWSEGFGAMSGIWKNLAVVGGLLYVMAYGAGEGWKLDR
jgi:putative oxidoreductase